MGLADDGTPKNPDTANNHLHLMVTVPDPMNAGDWVQIDPYGVYNQKSESGCYDLLDTSAYVRLFAPFYPTFHNVPAEYIGFYWGYYTGMEMVLRTISLHRRGDRVFASGSFQRGLPAAWYMRMYMTGDDYQKWATTYYERGFRPREISVTQGAGGEPRFTVIWKKIAGERFLARHGMSDADWQTAWQDQVVNRDRRVDERVVYREGNRRRTAAVFVTSAPSGFYEYHRLTARAYQDTVDALAARGWRVVKAEAEELREGLRFGGIWQRKTGAWAARHDLSPAAYQAQAEDLTGKGYRLIDIQGYADSRRFIAVWEKP